ncbi:MAG: penicillin-binding transpeptidase domain-containing protein [Chloroflexota bacterium]
MQFAREINRLVIGFLAILFVVAAAATYWAITGAETILTRQDNPRQVEVEASIRRGSILDRNGQVLVDSSLDANSALIRQYLYPEMYSALGYFSFRYGASGAEAAYDAILKGDNLPRDLSAYLSNDLLHRPRQGSDIRLTFDLTIQQALDKAMAGHQGAAVVLSVPSGEVLGMASLPTFDPNTLDVDWEKLIEAPGNPFFNRALQGSYQPGGTLQTPLIAAAMLTGSSLDTPIEYATQPVSVANVELHCAAVLPPKALTLREAYIFGCPYPFSQLANNLGVDGIDAIFHTFHLDNPTNLPGYIVQPPSAIGATPTNGNVLPDTLVKSALGQGQLTITPLEMAMVTAAIVNDGNAPQPYTLLDTRQPYSEDWIDDTTLHPSTPLTTATTARQLQDMMRLAVADGAAQNAGRAGIDIGGHATLAYSGTRTQAWFVGFATLGGRQGIAIAVVIEDSNDPGLAADIGGTILAASRDALTK